MERIEQIRKEIEGIIYEEYLQLTVTVSMGGVISSKEGEKKTAEELVQVADKALYRAKMGRNASVYVKPDEEKNLTFFPL